jgi:hypothetical protein
MASGFEFRLDSAAAHARRWRNELMTKILPGVFVALIMWTPGTGAFAADEAREKLIAEFTKTIGLEDVVRESQRETERLVTDQVGPLLSNLRQAGYSAEALKEIQGILNDMMKKVVNSWSPAEGNRIYTVAIAESMTDEALKASIAFYQSPEGVKSKAAIGAASAKMRDYINTEMMKVLKPEMQAFMERIKGIAAREQQKRQADQKPATAPRVRPSEPPPADVGGGRSP